MRVGVYAPSKNEAHHVKEWYNSCKDADIICVADTGSTDNTVKLMEELGINVTHVRIIPFRFDDAFNIAMSLLPADIDVCIRLDLDERLQPGWRAALESAWTPTSTKLRYIYVWNWASNGKPGLTWYGDRIHARANYRWVAPTHEGLCYRGNNEVQTYCNELKIYHYPDIKNKKNDLSLLLEAVKEYPTDARIKSYLGREYMYQNQNDKAIEVYKEFLGMSWDKAERQQAMCNLSTLDSTNKVYWLKLAAIESPIHREPLVNLSQHYYNIGDWQQCYEAAKKALAITDNPMDYTCQPENWAEKPHDLISIALWNLKLYKESLEHAKLALDYNPTDARLQNNFKLIESFILQNLSNK